MPQRRAFIHYEHDRAHAAQLGSGRNQHFCADHPERYLLAFVYGYLGEHDLLSVRTDAEKFLLLTALNLVECVAFVGARLRPK